MLSKREKHEHISAMALLGKYDKDENPANQNVASSYDKELHTPIVLTKYLNQDIKFLQAILEANKGTLEENNSLYKEVSESLRYAASDLENAKNNFKTLQNKFKNEKRNAHVNKKSELTAAENALEDCQKRFDRMESFKNFLDELEEGSIDKEICQQLKLNIKNLRTQIDKIEDLTQRASAIHKKYLDYWGEDEENIEVLLESQGQKIDKKEIKEYDKILVNLDQLLNHLPKQYELLDGFLLSLEVNQNEPPIG